VVQLVLVVVDLILHEEIEAAVVIVEKDVAVVAEKDVGQDVDVVENVINEYRLPQPYFHFMTATACERKSLTNCPKIGKPHGFFSSKIEERRILSSPAKQGESRDVTFPRHPTYHYHLQKPERSRFHSDV
jgi:hypothetical protein